MTQAPFLQSAQTWNRRFATPEFLFGTAPNAYLAKQLYRLPPCGKALSIADGEGRNSVWLARQGLQVDAFDFAEAGVAKAQALSEQQGVKVCFTVCDVDDWPWRASAYDVVAAIFIQFADPVLRARLFARMSDTLKPGGTLILQGYTPRQLEFDTGGPGRLDHLYTADMVRSAFDGMDLKELIEYEEVLAEGSQHVGQSALLGMVAVRR